MKLQQEDAYTCLAAALPLNLTIYHYISCLFNLYKNVLTKCSDFLKSLVVAMNWMILHFCVYSDETKEILCKL